MTDALKPCPFCGGRAKLHPSCFGMKDDRCEIECVGCGMATGLRDVPELIAAWNRRALPAVQPQVADECGHPWCGAKCGEPNHAALLRAAMDLPEVRALVDAARRASHATTNDGITGRIYTDEALGLQRALAAYRAIRGGGNG